MRSFKICILALALATSVANASWLNCMASYGNIGCSICVNLSSVAESVAKENMEAMRNSIQSKIDGEYFVNLDTLKAIYADQIGALQVQNKLLEQYLALLQQSALQEKKRAFLMNKYNAIQNIIIDIEAVEIDGGN